MSKIDSIEKAGRLARTMASDVVIYNEEKIRKGIENDTLFDELESDIREAEKMWHDKVSAEIVEGTNIFQKAFIDQLFSPRRAVSSAIF